MRMRSFRSLRDLRMTILQRFPRGTALCEVISSSAVTPTWLESLVRRVGCRDVAHHRQREIEQTARRNEHAVRVPDLAAAVPGALQVRVENLREEMVRPVGVYARARRVVFLATPPHPLAVLIDRHLEARDPFVRNVHDMLGVVQEGDRVVVGPEHEDLAIALEKPLERRAGAKGVLPPMGANDGAGVLPPDDEPRGMIVDARVRPGSKELDRSEERRVG